ncbi:MAG: hypothetical protein C7B46_05605 [Sulfobacillus benefaciens]|uniref:Uncharacterized protein n=1 Tax=Sulfobacillus benefaciens TaxID=453960 RepID=A0A2T2XIR1_9FIRM|nr:MAG: hypothetical protein C7B46_05605 [Sulfobacillus benefaciens]
MKAPVEIEYVPQAEDSQMERYSSRIVLRDNAYDYLDALRSSAGDVILGWTLVGSEVYLLWGQDSYLYRYRIVIDEVLDPLPAMRVTYLTPPRRHNRRREWRSNTKIPGKFTKIAGEQEDPPETPRMLRTISRNISYSAIRFYSRHSLKPDTRLKTQWQLPDGNVLAGEMRVLRTLNAITVYQGIEGHDIVAVWDPPLNESQLNLWKAFCDRHRYD